MNENEKIIRNARIIAAAARPYFATALYGLTIIESAACPNFGIDRYWRLYYNPAWMQTLGQTQKEIARFVAVILLHEIQHALRKHHERAISAGVSEMTYRVATLAQNLEIQDDLLAALKAQANAAENRLPVPDEQKSAQNILAHKADPETPLGFDVAFYAQLPSTYGLPDDQLWETYYYQLLPMVDFVFVNCGSGAHGVPQPWDLPAPSNGGPHGLDEGDAEDVRRKTAQAIKNEERGHPGSVPAELVAWADQILRVRPIPWDREISANLRGAITHVTGQGFHSYCRPSRRQHAYGNILMPSLRKPVPNVTIVGDTSGSMSDHALCVVRGVVEDVCRSLGAACTFLSCDAAVHGPAQQAYDGHVKLMGRGGTNMIVGIEQALSVRPRPDAIVVVTDCDTPWPIAPLGKTKIIVAAVDAHSSAFDAVPPWMRKVRVQEATT